MKSIISILTIILILTITGCQEASVNPYLKDKSTLNDRNVNKYDFPNTVGSYWIYELIGVNKYYIDTVEVRITGFTKLGFYDSVSVWSYYYRLQNYSTL